MFGTKSNDRSHHFFTIMMVPTVAILDDFSWFNQVQPTLSIAFSRVQPALM